MQDIMNDSFNTELHPGSIKGAMKEADAGRKDLWLPTRSPLQLIEGFNTRTPGAELDAHIRGLANSMKSEGFYQHKPLAGYVAQRDGEQTIFIYDGHCRLAAYDLAVSEGAELDEHIPVVVQQTGISMEDLLVVLVQGNGGKPLSPYEKAVVCKRLTKYGWDESRIGERLNLTREYVRDLLTLTSAPVELRRMVESGAVSATVAIDIINKHGERAVEKMEQAAAKAAASGKSRVTAKHASDVSPQEKAVRKNALEVLGMLRDVMDDDKRDDALSRINQFMSSIGE